MNVNNALVSLLITFGHAKLFSINVEINKDSQVVDKTNELFEVLFDLSQVLS